MLSMLIRLMLAQAQECLFEKIALPGIRNQFCPLIKMAQEAAKVKISPLFFGDTALVDRCLGNSMLSFHPGRRNLRPSPPVHDPDAN